SSATAIRRRLRERRSEPVREAASLRHRYAAPKESVARCLARASRRGLPDGGLHHLVLAAPTRRPGRTRRCPLRFPSPPATCALGRRRPYGLRSVFLSARKGTRPLSARRFCGPKG